MKLLKRQDRSFCWISVLGNRTLFGFLIDCSFETFDSYPRIGTHLWWIWSDGL